MTFIKKLTASSSATLSFVNGASSVVLDTLTKNIYLLLKISSSTNNGSILLFK